MTHVSGWAFGGPQAKKQAQEIFFSALKFLGIPRPEINEQGGYILTDSIGTALRDLRLETRHGYNSYSVRLDPKRTAKLTAEEKVLIADLGNGCFGGRVEGPWTFVYTD